MVDVPLRQPPAVLVWQIQDAADGGVRRHGNAIVGRDKPRRHAENPPHRAAVGDDKKRLAWIFAGGCVKEIVNALLEDFTRLAVLHVGNDIFVRKCLNDFRMLLFDFRLAMAFEDAAVPFAEVVDMMDRRIRMVFTSDFRRLDGALQITAIDGVDMPVFQIFGGAFDLFDAVIVQRAFVPALKDAGLVGHGLPVAQEYEAGGIHIDFVVDRIV